MSKKQELIWHVSGTVVETIYNLGNRNKPYWQVIVEIEGVSSVSMRATTKCDLSPKDWRLAKKLRLQGKLNHERLLLTQSDLFFGPC